MDHSTEAGRKRIGKHPFGWLAPHWKEDATTDLRIVRGCLAQQPEVNFAIATGGPHRRPEWVASRHLIADENEDEIVYLVVVDLDGVEAEAQIQQYSIPKTFTVATGRGRRPAG